MMFVFSYNIIIFHSNNNLISLATFSDYRLCAQITNIDFLKKQILLIFVKKSKSKRQRNLPAGRRVLHFVFTVEGGKFSGK